MTSKGSWHSPTRSTISAAPPTPRTDHGRRPAPTPIQDSAPIGTTPEAGTETLRPRRRALRGSGAPAARAWGDGAGAGETAGKPRLAERGRPACPRSPADPR